MRNVELLKIEHVPQETAQKLQRRQKKQQILVFLDVHYYRQQPYINQHNVERARLPVNILRKGLASVFF